MPVITDIKQQKRRQERVSVFLDGEFWTGMSRNCFLALSLRKDQQLDADDVKDIEEKVVLDSGLFYAMERLSHRLLSEKQLRDKLIGREYGESVIDQVIVQCRELHLLDDEHLAHTLAAERRDRGQGRKRVEQHLREIGVDKQLMDDALDEAFQPEQEDELAMKALESKFGGDGLDRRQQQRARAFLMRRGFSGQVSNRVAGSRALSEDEESALHGPQEAMELLRKKYSVPLSGADRRRAYGFLARRGFTSGVISIALDSSLDEEAF